MTVERVFKVKSVFKNTSVSRFTKIVKTNKVSGIETRVFGTGTVIATIVIVVIRESRGICPNTSTRVPIYM